MKQKSLQRDSQLSNDSRKGNQNPVNLQPSAQQTVKPHPDYVSPLADTAFIRLFASNERKYNTLNFLRAIFENDPEFSIDDITINDPRFPGETKYVRGCVCDLHCTCGGKSYLIELQMYNEVEVFMDRAIFNMSKQISTDHAAGSGHVQLNGTIFIGITDFDLDGLEGRGIVRIALGDMDEKGKFFLTDRFRLFFFQLNNFKKNIDECTTKLDFWLYSLKNLHNMSKDDELTKLVQEKVNELKPFFDDAEYDRMTPQEQDVYLQNCTNLELERRARIKRELKVAMKEKEGLEKGLAQGLAQGLEQGMAQGLEQGMAQGLEQGKMETAKALKIEGIPLDVIARCTGLSLETINGL